MACGRTYDAKEHDGFPADHCVLLSGDAGRSLSGSANVKQGSERLQQRPAQGARGRKACSTFQLGSSSAPTATTLQLSRQTAGRTESETVAPASAATKRSVLLLLLLLRAKVLSLVGTITTVARRGLVEFEKYYVGFNWSLSS